jgi:hypothetical protein
MQPKALTLLLVAALSLPVFSGPILSSAAMAEATQTQPRKGFFAFLRPAADRHARADRQANADDKARAALKAAVQVAVENRPRGRLWCVPFARAVTGVDLRGNAKTWWHQAKGRYDRGNEPQIGAVMTFSGSRSMPRGHVAVVSQVLSDREVLIDQANWERNRITLDTLVVDVSAKGDWSQVRVANGNGTLGRVNPVYGFIYN